MISACTPRAAKWFRDIDEFGGDTQTRARQAAIFQTRRHQAAARDAEIERLVQIGAAVFEQHILARHTDIGSALAHIGRHIGTAQHHQAHIGLASFRKSICGCSLISSSGTMPASASSGSVSLRMRPLVSAIVSGKAVCVCAHNQFDRRRMSAPNDWNFSSMRS